MAPAPADLRFLLEAEALKREPRRGWLRTGVRRPESVADHSWRLALMAMLYADLLGLDPGRAARIAIVHDLPEARTGDTLPGERTPYRKHALEDKALRGILAPLPLRLQKAYHVLWLDYEHGGSPEAALVEELDKLEMAAQALAYERRAGARSRRFDGFWDTTRKHVRTPLLRARLEALERRRPRAAAPARSRGKARTKARCKAQPKPTARRASSNSGRGSRRSRKRYSRSPRTR